MPAHINYETTPIIFYKFVCENPEIKSCYVGHTTNFGERKRNHKHVCNNTFHKNHHYKIYQTIRENGGWNKWKIVEINRQICLDKSDAGKIEQQYIDELQANMNMRNATFNKKEYTLENKNRFALIKNQILKCECGSNYTHTNRVRHAKTKKHLVYLETLKITL